MSLRLCYTERVGVHMCRVNEARSVTYSLTVYSFSADVSCSSSLLVTFRSAASTIPSCARIPSAVPACDIASRAYSTW